MCFGPSLIFASKGIAERLKATIKVSKNYKSYSGLAEGMDGDVKFLYKTAEVE